MKGDFLQLKTKFVFFFKVKLGILDVYTTCVNQNLNLLKHPKELGLS